MTVARHARGQNPLSVSVPRLVLLALALGGCASGGLPGGGAPAAYTLTKEETDLDCHRLTGRMQVRLLSLRGTEYKVGASEAAGAMRSATSAALGTDTAKNAALRAANDRPLLEAYNQRLVALGCASFDLDKELAARPSAPTPMPTVPPPSKRKS